MTLQLCVLHSTEQNIAKRFSAESGLLGFYAVVVGWVVPEISKNHNSFIFMFWYTVSHSILLESSARSLPETQISLILTSLLSLVIECLKGFIRSYYTINKINIWPQLKWNSLWAKTAEYWNWPNVFSKKSPMVNSNKICPTIWVLKICNWQADEHTHDLHIRYSFFFNFLMELLMMKRRNQISTLCCHKYKYF
jgi:hypothetical protein